VSHPDTHGREPRTATNEDARTGSTIDEKRADEQQRQALLRRVGDGELDAWAELWGRVAPAVHGFMMNRSFALRMQGPAQRVQERIGDVSAVAHESIEGRSS